MLLLYFKQAWNLIRQEKLFSSIYIIGTGLSITMVMVLSIVFYIKIANIYPETKRDRLLIVKRGKEIVKNGFDNNSSISEHLITTCFRPLKSAETVAAVCNASDEECYIQLPQSKEQIPISASYVDDQFWKVFDFRFLGGKPFTEADFQSGIHTAVIAESLAKKVYGTTEVTGKYISFDFRLYRICGVVKDVSFATDKTYGQLWVPYTTRKDYKHTWGSTGSLGNFYAFILCPDKKDIPVVKQEALDNLHRYNLTLGDKEISLLGQPDRQWQSIFRFWGSEEIDFTGILLKYGLIFLVLLGVPAISLSGMADSRMERRLTEMGIRRAFGAPNRTLMIQIISENLLFTFLGGLAGLLFSYVVILIARNSILQIGQDAVTLVPEGTTVVFTPAMLMNMNIFTIALVVCLLLNLVSVVIPAWRASRRDIIHSLNTK